MLFEEAVAELLTWDSKTNKKTIAEIGKDKALEQQVSEYFAEILAFAEFKLADLPKVGRRLTTLKFLKKRWTPSAHTVSILNTLTIDYLSLNGSKSDFPGWIKHVNFETLNAHYFEPDQIVFPRSVVSLQIEYSGLKEIPLEFKQLRPQNLGLSNNNIEVVPEWVFDIGLRDLALDSNKISKVEVSKPAAFRRLSLRSNSLAGRPEFLSLLDIEVLDISRNQIDSLPSLSRRIKQLFLSDNDFDQVPPQIAQLQELSFLDLARNKITSFPRLQFPKLCSLNLAGNPAELPSLRGQDEVQLYLASFFESDTHFQSLLLKLESRDPVVVEAGLREAQADSATLERVRNRYLTYIQARLGKDATLSDLPKVIPSEQEEQVLEQAFLVQQGAAKLLFERLDGPDCKLIVDFIGSLVESAVDVESLVQEFSQCKDEQALIQASKARLEAIQHELFQRSMEFREGWLVNMLQDSAR